MRLETIRLYTFEELDEKAKERAREWWREGLGFNEWWWVVEEDAEQIGLKLTEFDIYRGTISGDFTGYADDVAHLILKNHGRECETWNDAVSYIREKTEFVSQAEKDEYGDLANYDDENTVEEIQEEFKKALLESYLVMLQKEYEWLNSDEAVDETIVANEYEFTANGDIW